MFLSNVSADPSYVHQITYQLNWLNLFTWEHNMGPDGN